MLIELRYQCYIHACSGKYFYALFQSFCVKRSDGVSGRLDGAPVCPDRVSGCPDNTVDSSGRPFFLT
jgi:hypothetical protein